ncbi:NagC family transcriptional regulator [Microbacterium sorbitolivorans]|uniref:ROK family protein n=1 Tax=Microbacterium sorbitolivorans TaxID=1867410 RepID=A0A367YA78_9MICO|nr:ROK family protein [Microbacterium sorbitolivorans]RCK61922.1 ROK family protein [Microbacterium sorbitolivorans]GGF44577.1 NagC family transcriptional regulator [Microbacterium sorbitolivorans]
MSGPLRVGIDVGGTSVEAVALAADGSIAARSRVRTARGEEGVVASILDAVGGLGVDAATIGIGVPGRIDAGRVYDAVNLGVRELHLAAEIAGATGVPVAIDNDVRAAALGAASRWEMPNLAYLNLGTGVAAGVVIDGRVVDGSAGVAGEIGHLAIDPGGPVCACGQRGCIEAFAGGGAITERAGEPLERVSLRADAGDEVARRVVADLARGAAAAVRVLALAVDPERVLVGGGIARRGERLRDEIAGELARAADGSAFLASLRLAERIEIVSPDEAVGAVGAALVGDRLVA